MVRMTGRPTTPIPAQLFGPATQLARRFGLFEFSDDFRRLLHYGRAVDIARLTEEVGFRPRYSTEAAVGDYGSKLNGRRLVPAVNRAVRLT
jgi:UDP-glucose 4-epimerase